MFRRIDKLVLDELEKNINKSHLISQGDAVQKLKSILQKPVYLRSGLENDQLVTLVQEIKFFQERAAQIQESDLRDLTQSFQVVELSKGENVIKFGEAGDTFYTIIEGKISVQIPNPGMKHWHDHRNQFDKLKKWYDQYMTPYVNKAKRKFLQMSADKDENKEQLFE